MSAKLSKDVTDLVRDGNFVLSAIETDGSFIASSYLEETRPHLEEGDDEPRADAFLVALSRRLRASLDRLVASDFKVAEAEARESVLRAGKKEARRQLGFLIVALRRLVMAHYVEPDMDNLGLQPLNVRDSFTVLRRALLIAERFAAVNLARMLGESRFDKPAALGSYVDEIRAKAEELLALAEEVDEAHRETDRARRERKAAKKEFQRVYLRASRLFEDLCRLAGHDGIAARVRRTPSRPARSANESVDDGDVTDRAKTEAAPRKAAKTGQELDLVPQETEKAGQKYPLTPTRREKAGQKFDSEPESIVPGADAELQKTEEASIEASPTLQETEEVPSKPDMAAQKIAEGPCKPCTELQKNGEGVGVFSFQEDTPSARHWRRRRGTSALLAAPKGWFSSGWVGRVVSDG